MLLSASGELTSFLALFTELVLLWRRWRGKRAGAVDGKCRALVGIDGARR